MTDPANPAGAPPPAAASAPAAPVEVKITIDDFKKVELKIGRVLTCVKHPKADKLLILKVDLGAEQRQVLAGMAPYYPPEELVGKHVVICTNLAPRMMRGEESNGMMLAATDGDKVFVLSVDKPVSPGSRVS
jgi:methionyl-tRNA synthetase